MILAEDVVEYLGSIFSRKDLVTHVDNVVSRPRNSMCFVKPISQKKEDVYRLAIETADA